MSDPKSDLELRKVTLQMAAHIDTINEILIEKGVITEEEFKTRLNKTMEQPNYKETIAVIDANIAELEKMEENPYKYLFDTLLRGGKKEDEQNGKEA